MTRLSGVVAAALIGGAAALVVSSPAHAVANGDPCVWYATTSTAYKIGISPKVTITGNCNQGANWHANIDVTNTSTNTVATSLHFQGCGPLGQDADTDPKPGYCANIGSPHDNSFDYLPVTTLTMKVTSIGSYKTTLNPSSWSGYYGGIDYKPSLTSVSFTAKLATKVGLSITRSGTLRTFTITPQHWSVSAGKYAPTTNHNVLLQRYVSGKWSTFKTLNSTKSTIVYSTHLSATYKWRAYTSTTASYWSAASPSITK